MEDAVLTEETRQAIGDLAEMLAAMERASVQGLNAFTSRELRRELNCGEGRCADLIRRAIEAGALRPCRKSITDMAGRPQMVPAYEQIKRETADVPRQRTPRQ